MPDIEIKECEPMRLAAIRHVGPYMEIGKAFERLGAYAGRHGLFGPWTRMVGLYLDDPTETPDADLRADAGMTLPEGHEPAEAEGVRLVHVDGGPYACAVHEGHYSGLGQTYGAIMAWMGEHDRTMAPKPCVEVYLNSPQDTRPDDLRTEVRVPVA
jgi:AraC family transcriptional regulator